MTAVHLVVPAGIRDSAEPSGGNLYDHNVSRELAGLGWIVRVHAVAGSWPHPDDAARAALRGVLGRLPDGAVVVVDGLVGSSVPDVLGPEGRRLRIVVLVHMPLGLGAGDDSSPAADHERAVLRDAAAVITTSRWTRDLLVGGYDLPAGSVHVAEPGVDAADVAVGSAAGGSLLCVATVASHKGHDVLLDALASLRDRPWTCTIVGSLTRDPSYVLGLRERIRVAALEGRVRLTGALVGPDLEHAYADVDALVLASHAETYGMVVTEALARGLPVIASDVGGVPLALGRVSDGTRPGLLVPAGDAVALADALRRWLEDAGLRQRLRAAALERRTALAGWPSTAQAVSDVLAQVAA